MPDDRPKWYWLPARRQAWREEQERAAEQRRRDREDAITRLRQRTSFEPARPTSDPGGDLAVMTALTSPPYPTTYCAPVSNDTGYCGGDSGGSSSGDGGSSSGGDGGSSGC